MNTPLCKGIFAQIICLSQSLGNWPLSAFLSFFLFPIVFNTAALGANDFPLLTARQIQLKNAKLSFGAAFRLRYEYRMDFEFDDDTNKDDGLWLFRTRLNLNAALNKKVSLFVEGLDAREWGSNVSPRKEEDNFDLHQGYLKLSEAWHKSVTLTLGRQELQYGAKRLVSAPTWGNKIRSFDALKVACNLSPFDVDLFVGGRVRYQDDRFNDVIWGEMFYGIYATFKRVPGMIFDIYCLNLVDKKHEVRSEDGTYGDLEQYTIGTRGEGAIGATDLDWGYEIAYQLGDRGSDEIRAYAYHLDVSYHFQKALFAPKIALEYNVATGDKNHQDGDCETFVPLFQAVHRYFGIIDFFKWQNIEHYGLSLNFVPVEGVLKGSLHYHRFYLNEKKDAWYNAKGKPLRLDRTGRASDYVGDELDLVLRYAISEFLFFQAGYARFFAGEYVSDTGSSDDADFIYVQTIAKF